jgi:hypothetical protein
MFALGAIYSGDHAIPVDRIKAEHWFRAAAERGHGQAQLMLARYLPAGASGRKDLQQARDWLERAAAQGVAEAEAELTELNANARLAG